MKKTISNKNCKLSIVTVVYNGEATIKDTIASIQSQGYDNIEHVIIDGGSTDGTIDVVKSYGDKISVFVSEPDDGLYNAMNKGVKLSSGKIIATLNSDDIYPNSVIVSNMMAFIADNNLDAAYGDLEYFRGDDQKTITRHWRPGVHRPGSFFRGWVPPHPTFFCKKTLFERFGYFRVDMPCAADYELMLRFIEKNRIKVAYLPETIVKMRMGGVTNTAKGVIKGNFHDMLKAFKVNGYGFPLLFFPCKLFSKIAQYKTFRLFGK